MQEAVDEEEEEEEDEIKRVEHKFQWISFPRFHLVRFISIR